MREWELHIIRGKYCTGGSAALVSRLSVVWKEFFALENIFDFALYARQIAVAKFQEQCLVQVFVTILGNMGTSETADEKPWVSERCPCFTEEKVQITLWLLSWWFVSSYWCFFLVKLYNVIKDGCIQLTVHECIWISGLLKKIRFVLACELGKNFNCNNLEKG